MVVATVGAGTPQNLQMRTIHQRDDFRPNTLLQNCRVELF